MLEFLMFHKSINVHMSVYEFNVSFKLNSFVSRLIIIIIIVILVVQLFLFLLLLLLLLHFLFFRSLAILLIMNFAKNTYTLSQLYYFHPIQMLHFIIDRQSCMLSMGIQASNFGHQISWRVFVWRKVLVTCPLVTHGQWV